MFAALRPSRWALFSSNVCILRRCPNTPAPCRSGFADSVSVQAALSSGNTTLFTTNSTDVVGSGYDAAGAEYVTLRTTGIMSPIPSANTEIFVSGCCRFASVHNFRFSTMYVPSEASSILTQPPAYILVERAAPTAYAYAFVPAVSSDGAAIDCNINTGSYVELTASAATGGCRVRWDNQMGQVGDTVDVKLRVSKGNTGLYSDITFFLMIADLSGAPEVHAVSSGGQTLNPNGDTIQVTFGTLAQVVFLVEDPSGYANITASSTTLPAGATLTTTPADGLAPITVMFSWTPTASNPLGLGLVVVVFTDEGGLSTFASFSYNLPASLAPAFPTAAQPASPAPAFPTAAHPAPAAPIAAQPASLAPAFPIAAQPGPAFPTTAQPGPAFPIAAQPASLAPASLTASQPASLAPASLTATQPASLAPAFPTAAQPASPAPAFPTAAQPAPAFPIAAQPASLASLAPAFPTAAQPASLAPASPPSAQPVYPAPALPTPPPPDQASPALAIASQAASPAPAFPPASSPAPASPAPAFPTAS
ncbi:hypothetical protein PLESTB_000636200 [Pleodorina starrii]|uniref:Uncharacterized protein n=1 Tax=Pleodorina starrii TaxID=330485 RepID=A0A9W6BHV1_9CHLO|nr:hypothetical protein PLESTB_000636200 [Pleodorina starrii]